MADDKPIRFPDFPLPCANFEDLRAVLRRLFAEVEGSESVRDLNHDNPRDARITWADGEGLQVAAWHGPRDWHNTERGGPLAFVTVTRTRNLRLRVAWPKGDAIGLAELRRVSDSMAAFLCLAVVIQAFAELAGLTLDVDG